MAEKLLDYAVPSSNQPLAGFALVDVNTYLNQFANVSDENSRAKTSSRPDTRTSAKASATPTNTNEPDILKQGLGTAESVTRFAASMTQFAHVCQIRRLTPQWDIREAQPEKPGGPKFYGSLTIGDKEFAVDELQQNKKVLRGLLAEKALPIVKALEIPSKKTKLRSSSMEETEDKRDSEEVNWVGKLLGKLNSSFHSTSYA